MERVQFQQEEMLAELKDLVQKNLFTLKETRLILQRRTELERALVRRIPQKSDFLRYIDYERGLEQLRRKRVKRILGDSSDGPATLSDYALIRRQFHIFERALKKFKDDIGLWIQYIELATKEGASTLVGRICARAIQLHPTSTPLFILAAAHELRHGSPSAARTLLQRGIRMNTQSVELWREYVKMELGFIESLKQRWDILGINPDRPETRDILDGAIVRSVLDQAFKAVPTLELFNTLRPVLEDDGRLLDHLYSLLEEATLPRSAAALGLILQHTVRPDMDPEDLVDAMKRATDKIIEYSAIGSEREEVISEFKSFWLQADIDDALKEYVIDRLECVNIIK